MKVLVTGGAGFIGSHLVRRLMALGYEVTVLDNLSTGVREHLPEEGFAFWELDDRAPEARERIVAGHFDAIVHLAGQTMVDASIRDPHFDASENVLGTVNVLEAARASGVKRVIFASTAAAYGDVEEDVLPLQEQLPLAPMSFYGLTKVMVERYLALYHALYGLDYVVLRFANVYGERQGDKGEGGVIKANIGVAEGKYQINKKFTLRGELQYLSTSQDQGDWAFGLLELSALPYLMFTVSDMWNTGETDIHYYMASVTGTYKAHRLMLGYGRTRAGYNCSGGVCRYVPASKGLNISYNYTF